MTRQKTKEKLEFEVAKLRQKLENMSASAGMIEVKDDVYFEWRGERGIGQRYAARDSTTIWHCYLDLTGIMLVPATEPAKLSNSSSNDSNDSHRAVCSGSPEIPMRRRNQPVYGKLGGGQYHEPEPESEPEPEPELQIADISDKKQWTEAEVRSTLMAFYTANHPEFASDNKVFRIIDSFKRKEDSTGQPWYALLWAAYQKEGVDPRPYLHDDSAAQTDLTVSDGTRDLKPGSSEPSIIIEFFAGANSAGTPELLSLFWERPNGSLRAFGTIATPRCVSGFRFIDGEKRRLNTHVGHRWVIKDSGGTVRYTYTVRPEDGQLISVDVTRGKQTKTTEHRRGQVIIRRASASAKESEVLVNLITWKQTSLQTGAQHDVRGFNAGRELPRAIFEYPVPESWTPQTTDCVLVTLSAESAEGQYIEGKLNETTSAPTIL
eukprot:COSAG05_NODE_4648_length_1424_cov_1.387925_1_plen_433_part_10